MEYITEYFVVLFKLTMDMAPYLLLGFLFAGILKVTIPSNIMTKYLGKNNTSSVINASLLGVPLPLCSCGVLPAGISLYKNGASKGSSVSFLISTPQTGVDSVLVTWSMLGLPFAILRPILAFFTGIIGGVLTNKFDKTQISNYTVSEKKTKQKFSIREIFRYAFVEMINDIAKWLVIGLLIAAFITIIIPDNFFLDFHLNGISGMILILVVSIPLYICATASVPIAAVLLLKGLSPGALLVFLMAGPATNAATMTVIGKNLGKKTLLIYMSSLIGGSLLFGLFIDYFLPASWFAPLSLFSSEHNHEILPEWLTYLSTALLIILISISFIKSAVQKVKIMNNKTKISDETKINTLTLSVEGMSCINCKAKVENGLLTISGVSEVLANNETDIVSVLGHNINAKSIGEKIKALGYEFKGEIKN